MASPTAERTSACLLKDETLRVLDANLVENGRGGNAVINNSVSRFQIWAANIGTYHAISDTKSADYRLREALAIVKLLTDVLDELCETLDDIQDIITEERPDQSLVQGSTDTGTNAEVSTSQGTSASSIDTSEYAGRLYF